SAAGPADALLGVHVMSPPERVAAPGQTAAGALLIANPRTSSRAAPSTVQATATSEPTPAPTAEPAAPPPVEVQPPVVAAPPPPTDRLVIPRIKLDTKVLDVGVLPSGVMDTAAYAAGRLTASAEAGEAGNMVLAGHDDIL